MHVFNNSISVVPKTVSGEINALWGSVFFIYQFGTSENLKYGSRNNRNFLFLFEVGTKAAQPDFALLVLNFHFQIRGTLWFHFYSLNVFIHYLCLFVFSYFCLIHYTLTCFTFLHFYQSLSFLTSLPDSLLSYPLEKRMLPTVIYWTKNNKLQ